MFCNKYSGIRKTSVLDFVGHGEVCWWEIPLCSDDSTYMMSISEFENFKLKLNLKSLFICFVARKVLIELKRKYKQHPSLKIF